MQVDWTKLLITLIGIVCLTALAITDTVDGLAALGPIAAWVGIILGNGKTVVAGQEPGPLLSKRTKPLPPPSPEE